MLRRSQAPNTWLARLIRVGVHGRGRGRRGPCPIGIDESGRTGTETGIGRAETAASGCGPGDWAGFGGRGSHHRSHPEVMVPEVRRSLRIPRVSRGILLIRKARPLNSTQVNFRTGTELGQTEQGKQYMR